MPSTKEKVERKIISIVNEHPGYDALEIAREIGLTYDTTNKHLKRMSEKRLIDRKAKGRPWNFYYYPTIQ